MSAKVEIPLERALQALLAPCPFSMQSAQLVGIDALLRWTSLLLFTVVLLPAGAAAQTTSGTIRGTVATTNRTPTSVIGTVTVRDNETGRSIVVPIREGRFTAPGLAPGVPHTLIVRSVGFGPVGMRDIRVTMGEERTLHFALVAASSLIDTVWIRGSGSARRNDVTRLSFSQDELKRLPSLDRDFYDFVRLSPFATTRTARTGMSIGGVSTRYNNFMLDGVSDRGLVGNFAAATGQGAKAISLDAVKEYQLIVSPFDVRFGDFTGGLVNAVTRSGQNQPSGSVFGFSRTDDISRKNEYLTRSPYRRDHYGFSLSGPLVRNRAHFFIAIERQRLSSPARGPFVDGTSELPVRTSDIVRFQDILGAHGLATGTGGLVGLENPANNLFFRVDLSIPYKDSRLMVWHNYAMATNAQFTRESSTSFFTRGSTTFPLSSLRFEATAKKSVTAARLMTPFSRSIHNEAIAAIKRQPNFTIPEIAAPLVSVSVPTANNQGTAYLESGSAEAAHGVATRQNSFEVSDVLTLSHGRGLALFGARLEVFGVRGTSQPGAYGSWLFSSLDSLQRGIAQQYRLLRRLEAAPAATGSQMAIFVGERLSLRSSMSVTAGLRGEILRLSGAPAYNAVVDSLFSRRTSSGWGTSVDWSPRIGIEWQSRRNRLTGGAGLFSTRPPVGWLGQAQLNDGSGSSAVICAGQGENDPAAPVTFVPDYRAQPTTCAGGRDTRLMSGGAVNLAKPGRSMVRALRIAMGASREVGTNVTASLDALITRGLADFAFSNLNLLDLAVPDSLLTRDRRGRILYGTLDPALRGRPRTVTSTFSEVIEPLRHSKNSARQMSATLAWRNQLTSSLSASYTHSRVRDVQTPPSQFSFNENWQLGRVVSGTHTSLTATTSSLEILHRVVLSASHIFGKSRYSTELGFYYTGESGLPFTYVASAGRGRGDLNSDGTNLNDPIYVPHSALDTAQILFSGTQSEIARQQNDFERLIMKSSCLRRQRGRIMMRNSCRAPWIHTTAATVRQTLPFLRNSLVVQVDGFNLLNLVNGRWGKVRLVPAGAIFPVLEHVGQSPGTPATAQAIFRYDENFSRFSESNAESAFQLQLGVRYSF